MNRNRYRLVFNETLGMMVPVAESARRAGKSGSGKAASGSALALAGVLLAGPVGAELPVPSSGGGIPNFVSSGQAAYQVNGAQAYVNQVGNKSILNWQSFNVSPGHNVQFRQVDSLATNNLVQGASFTSLNRIWDINPSVIAGSITVIFRLSKEGSSNICSPGLSVGSGVAPGCRCQGERSRHPLQRYFILYGPDLPSPNSGGGGAFQIRGSLLQKQKTEPQRTQSTQRLIFRITESR